MSPGQLSCGQMPLSQLYCKWLTSVKNGPRKLTLKFGQNQVSNRGFVADVVIVGVIVVVVVLDDVLVVDVVLLLIPENDL